MYESGSGDSFKLFMKTAKLLKAFHMTRERVDDTGICTSKHTWTFSVIFSKWLHPEF